jgi:hypothetical protein
MTAGTIAQTPPKMKMTTDIPVEILTPDKQSDSWSRVGRKQLKVSTKDN